MFSRGFSRSGFWCGLVGAAILLGAPAQAQLPPGVFAGEPDARAAPGGAYVIDPDHTAVIVKVSHLGYGLSVFRFDKVQGRLEWHPEAPAGSTLEVKVATASISTPVPGFAKALAGDGYLKSDRYPEATFTTTAFHQTGPLRGTVTGTFTLMGVSRPLTFEATLQGAGRGFMGQPRIGVSAKGAIDPRDFGLGPLFDRPMPIEIDAEFAKA